MLSKRSLLVVAATMLSLMAIASTVAASSPRNGAIGIEKECSTYVGQAGGICTITSSSVAALGAGTTITYLQAADLTTGTLSTDVVIDPPGPGNNVAFGRCNVDLVTGFGECTLSGGTGTFNHVRATVDVVPLGNAEWAWQGTYSYSPRD